MFWVIFQVKKVSMCELHMQEHITLMVEFSFIRYWYDVSAWRGRVTVNVWNKDIKAWLCLSFDAFELLEVVGYSFNHFWTKHCMPTVRHWILTLSALRVSKFVAYLHHYEIEGVHIKKKYWLKSRGLYTDTFVRNLLKNITFNSVFS